MVGRMRRHISRSRLKIFVSSCDSAFLGLALCANVFQSGCRKTIETPPDIVFESKIAPVPPRTGPATVTLKLADSAGKPIDGVRINLEGNMSHPGMRPVFSEAREVESGRYQATLEFTMRGDWVILVHITLPDGRKLQRQIDVKGVGAG
jgi:YtkA-like